MKEHRREVVEYFLWDYDWYVSGIHDRTYYPLNAKMSLWREENSSLPQISKAYYFFNKFRKYASKKQKEHFLNNFDVVWC